MSASSQFLAFVFLALTLAACGGGGGGSSAASSASSVPSSSSSSSATVAALEFNQKTFITPGQSFKPVAGDFDKDGLTDLVLATRGTYAGGTENRLYFFRQGASGLEYASHLDFAIKSSPLSQLALSSMEACDIDGDGRAEIVVGTTSDSDTSAMVAGFLNVYSVSTRGEFSLVSSTPGTSSSMFSCVDVDNDGKYELVTDGRFWYDQSVPGKAPYWQSIDVYSFDAKAGQFVVKQQVSSSTTIRSLSGSMTSADINGDGLKDLVFSAYKFDDPMKVERFYASINKNGVFSEDFVRIAPFDWLFDHNNPAGSVVFADLAGERVMVTGARNPDFASNDWSRGIYALKEPLSSGSSTRVLAVTNHGGYLAFHDMNADGLVDMVGHRSGWGRTAVSLQKSAGVFYPEQLFYTVIGNGIAAQMYEFAFGDFNHDGRTDFVVGTQFGLIVNEQK